MNPINNEKLLNPIINQKTTPTNNILPQEIDKEKKNKEKDKKEDENLLDPSLLIADFATVRDSTKVQPVPPVYRTPTNTDRNPRGEDQNRQPTEDTNTTIKDRYQKSEQQTPKTDVEVIRTPDGKIIYKAIKENEDEYYIIDIFGNLPQNRKESQI